MAEKSPIGRKRQGPPDWILFGAVCALIAIGLMMVYSATFDMGNSMHGDPAYFIKRQLVSLGFGALAMVFAINFNYRYWMKLSIPIMLGALLMLIVLVALDKGRQLFGDSVSPVEAAKLAMIIYIGHWLASKRVEQLRKLPVGPLPFSIIVGAIAGLVMAQPDISEAMVIVLVAVAMYFLAGADWLQFAVGITGGVAAFVLVIRQLPQAMDRLEPFLLYWRDPWSSSNDQLRQGVIAMGNGSILGTGPGSGDVSHSWLPARHTDSIFAMIGEELGLVGCVIVIGLFALVAYRGFQIARHSPDSFGALVAIGVTCWISFQALVNMAVVTGTTPFTGIALPFISVGGSSLLMCMVAMGILLNISRAPVLEGV